MAAKKPGYAILFLLCLLGLAGNLSLVNFSNINSGDSPIYRAYYYSWLNPRIYLYAKKNKEILRNYADIFLSSGKTFFQPEVFLDKCKSLGEYQNAFYEGLGMNVGRFFRHAPSFEIEIVEQMPQKYRPDKKGFLDTGATGRILHNPGFLEKITRSLTNETKDFYYEKAGLNIGILLKYETESIANLVDGVKENGLKKSFVRGLGEGVARDGDIRKIIDFKEGINKDYIQDYFEGAGVSVGAFFIPDVNKIIKIGSKIDQGLRINYYRGIGKAAGLYFSENPTLILALINNNDLNFDIREYTFLTMGLYYYIGPAYSRAYSKGLGYGVAPYLYGYNAVVINKLRKFMLPEDFHFLLEGATQYFYEKVSQAYSFDRIYADELRSEFADFKQ